MQAPSRSPRPRPFTASAAAGRQQPRQQRRGGKGEGEDVWLHPEGAPLEEVVVGDVVDGIVTHAQGSRVFVDFGAVRDGLLRLPPGVARTYRKGSAVSGITITSVDLATGRVNLEFEPEQEPSIGQPERRALTPEPSRLPQYGSEGESLQPPRSRQNFATFGRSDNGGASAGASAGAGAGAGAGMGSGGRPAGSRLRRAASDSARSRHTFGAAPAPWSHPQGVPLEQVKVGSVVSGTVTNSSRYGVFVDFGAIKDGRLHLPKGSNREFKAGDKIPECIVAWIDLDAKRIGLSVPDHQAVMDNLARAPVTDFFEGQIVDGVVETKNQYGIFVNIGAVSTARLRGVRRGNPPLEHGKPVKGLRVEHIDHQRERITLTWAGEHHEGNGTVEPATRVTPGKKTLAPSTSAASTVGRGSRPAVEAEPEPGTGEVPSLRPGDFADGMVLKVTTRGVLVDIGVGAFMGLLEVPASLRGEFLLGDRVEGMMVTSINKQTKQVKLVLDNPALEVTEPVPSRPQPTGASTTGAGLRESAPSSIGRGSAGTRGSRSQQASGRQASRGDKCPLEGLWEGAEADGFVIRLVSKGALVDIGAERPGILAVSEDVRPQLRKGDLIQGMTIDNIDLQKRQFSLYMEDPQLKGPGENHAPQFAENSARGKVAAQR